MEHDKPDICIIHGGTNRIGKEDPFAIARDIVKTVLTCKEKGCNTIFVSGIIDRPDFSDQVAMLNNTLYQWQFLHDYKFIYNENIGKDCLAYDKHHLNVKGSVRLGANFRRAINKPYI